MGHPTKICLRLLLALPLLLSAPHSKGEAILQYFNAEWREIAEKMPEIVEAGYGALWLPPPTKASGGLSVGYDLWDPFDLGSKDQRGTVRTRYGTEAELLHLVEVAHRFGVRVYFDNIMNHRAFDIPGYNEDTPIDIYPGLLPEDFHLRVTPDGFYRKWDNTRDWESQWQVQNLGLADLIDIAHETPNTNFGSTEGSSHPKLSFVRDMTRPWQYDRAPNGDYVGFGEQNGLTSEILAANADFYKEDVGAYLIRAARWLMDRTKADGLRLDAVKHVPSYFFGQQSGAGSNSSVAGYLGGIQWQFNMSRGYSDWDNHRDSVFNHEQGRDDALVFGEHLGTPPGYEEYIQAGMRLLDAPLHREMNSRLGNPSASLAGLDQPGWSGNLAFSDSTGVAFAQSHDDDSAYRRELQHAYYLTRRGIANIYTDGYRKAGTLGESGGAFPRHANNPFLGQFGDPKLPHLLELREAFGRGAQIPRWSDSDVVAYERRDKSENQSMDDANGTVLMFMMNDNYAAGQARPIQTAFPAAPLVSDAYLHNYSTFNGGFYVWASDIAAGRVTIPPGGYFAFSWKNPDPSSLWGEGAGSPVLIQQSGRPAQSIRVTRRDGPDGDPEFNPYGLPNRGYEAGRSPEPYSYQMVLPRVTDPSDLSFTILSDGSTENVHVKLNGGIDINSQMGASFGPQDGDLRDNPPAISPDTFLGYEQARFVHRQHPEKFSAISSARNKIGSAGAETYIRSASGNFTIAPGPATANSPMTTMGGTTALFAYHDPTSLVSADNPSSPGSGSAQFSQDGSGLVVWLKTDNVGLGFRGFLYLTTDGSSPEGAGGYGVGATRVYPLGYRHQADSGTSNWWSTAPIRDIGSDVEIRYKLAVFKDRIGEQPVSSVWPGSPEAVTQKQRMMTVFEVSNFNAAEALYYPHNDYGETKVGLPDGWHVIRARAYLNRGSGSDRKAAIYRTFTQPFYLDAETPRGEIVFPSSDGVVLESQEYGFVVRTDPTVTEVWYHIQDSAPSNDDLSTGRWSGNGFGGEPFVDANRNGVRDPQEAFEDINGNGIYDANIGESWARATRGTPSQVEGSLMSEWRFPYTQVPASGTAVVRVRLLEASSSPRQDWQSSTTDSAGHFTTLTRAVTTQGPVDRVFVAWPPADGEVVAEGYVLKVYFSKSLTQGWSENQVINSFVIRLQNEESGRLEGGVAQSRANYSVVWDETPQYHALAFPLPNMYNGNPDWLHGIFATLTRPGVPPVEASRLVKAAPAPPSPSVEILAPQEIAPDGRSLEVILPATSSPSATDRQVPVTVRTDAPASSGDLAISFDFAPPDFAGAVALLPSTPEAPNPRQDGPMLIHEFVWSNVVEGQYRIRATLSRDNRVGAAVRNSSVVFRQVSPVDGSGDSDNDGLPDDLESTQVPLPSRNDETWTNAEVHVWRISGRTDATLVDSGASGLPDGLSLGLEWPISPSATSLAADTDSDGFPNFLPDLDPPIFNTPDRAGYDQRLPRTDQIGGSMTDPARPDDDLDGLKDALEDLNRNGRVDIGLLAPSGKVGGIVKHPNIPVARNSSAVLVSMLPSNARLLETDPNNPDTDGDGLADGQEDSDGNGKTNIFLLNEDGTRTPIDYTDRTHPHFKYNLVPNDDTIIFTDGARRDGLPHVALASRAVDYDALFQDYNAAGNGNLQSGGWPRLLITETDPLALDTIRDGFPDGWKARYGLDPLDNGVYNFRTGEPGNPLNLPSADLTGDGVTNEQHFLAGTDPRSTLTPAPPGGPNRINIGPGPAVAVLEGVTYYEEFTDWLPSDIVALDEYDGDGRNSQSGDIFPGYDGFDSSRDIVAFYARDGGAPEAGGDGKVYFRIDFDDLQPFAEYGHLDLYVAINHTPGIGERVLPDEVDTLTDMRWRVVLAVYDTGNTRVYLDTDPSRNSNNFGDPVSAANGVVSHSRSSPLGISEVYFNSELDAVEFAVPRTTLLASGWAGSDFGQLNFQVYTTRDGTSNSPRGLGDIAGRSDLRDTLLDDGVVEHNFFAQSGREDILREWVSTSARPPTPPRAKIVFAAEQSHSLQSGGWVQSRVNDGAGGGYYRLPAAHHAFAAPLTLAITPTLASALQWAAVDSSKGQVWRDGPSFNDSISSLGTRGLLDLLSIPLAAHTMLYTPLVHDAQNLAESSRWLSIIYNQDPSPSFLYLPERTLNSAMLTRVQSLGYAATFADQREHVEGWFGRSEALGDRGHKLNRVAGIDLLVISEDLGSHRFTVQDGGTSTQLRRALSRRSRRADQEQVVTIVSSLDDFLVSANADSYTRNIRWLSNRPWIEITTASDIVSRGWTPAPRSAAPAVPKSKGFVNYATLGSYDNWYFGNNYREGLAPKKFSIRPGVAMNQPFGLMSSSGVSHQAWQAVSALSPSSYLGRLGRAVMGSSLFATAFHETGPVDLRKFSNGDYINQPRNFLPLAPFASSAQSSLRHAAQYARVQQWAVLPNSSSHQGQSVEDIDLDEEPEYLMWNNRLFVIFEALGGRMTGAWLRDPLTQRVWQVVGNPLATSGFADEREGGTNEVALKTSGFKDWYALSSSGAGSLLSDTLYGVEQVEGGFRFSTSAVSKTITLPGGNDSTIRAEYQLQGLSRLYVRQGLSPNLEDLLLNGQRNLAPEYYPHPSRVELVNSNGADLVRAFVEVSSGGTLNPAASDISGSVYESLPLFSRRHQAQTHQVEVEMDGTSASTVLLLGFDNGFEYTQPDPFDEYMSRFFPSGSDPSLTSRDSDPDGDGLSNYQEFLFGTNPLVPDSGNPLSVGVTLTPTEFSINFDTLTDRLYTAEWTEDLADGSGWNPILPSVLGDGSRQSVRDFPSGAPRRFYRVRVAPSVE